VFIWGENVSILWASLIQSISLRYFSIIFMHFSSNFPTVMQRCTDFPKIWEPLENSRRHKGDTKQIPNWEPTNCKIHCTKCLALLTVTTPKRQSRATPCLHFITCNIMLPSMPRSSKWFLSFRLPHQNFVHFCPPSQCHVLRQFHPFIYKSWSFSLCASCYFLFTIHFPSRPFVIPSEVWIPPQDCS